MCSLNQFPPLPEGDLIPLCETEGRIQYSLPECANLFSYTSSVCLLMCKVILNYALKFLLKLFIVKNLIKKENNLIVLLLVFL